MNGFVGIHSVHRLDNAVMLVEKDPEIHVNHHPPTLDDVQRLARRIHHEHGGVTGGYTLDDWLEAEHELEDIDGAVSENNQVH